MVKMICKCDKCGLETWTNLELSITSSVEDLLPDGFNAITTNKEEYVFCDDCVEKLTVFVGEAIEEFVEKGEE